VEYDPLMSRHRRPLVAILLASTLGCVGAPEPDDAPRTTAAALTADGSPAPVSFHRGLASSTKAGFDALAAALGAEGYAPTAASAHRMPDGTVRYAGAWQRNPAVVSSVVLDDIPLASLLSSHTANTSAGMRIVDVDVESDGVNTRFCAVWWKGDGSPTSLELNLSRSVLDGRLATASSNGRRALRITPYRSGGATRFAVVWATDGGNGAAIVERPLSEVLPAFYAQLAAGRYMTDLSPHAWGSTVTWTATFAPMPGVRGSHYRSRMTPTEFVDEQRAMQREGYVLVDVDNWHDPAAGNAPVVSALWHRYVVRGTVSSSTAVDGFRTAVQQAMDDYRALNPSSRVGFLVEDLHDGGYLGHDADLPFYLASTTKVFLGAAAMTDLGIPAGAWNIYKATFVPERWRGHSGPLPGFTAADIGKTFSARRWLLAMVWGSDTQATDLFADELSVVNGAGFIDTYLRGHGLSQVGRVTSLCEVDRAVFSMGDPTHCLWAVPCNVMEHRFRTGDVDWPPEVVRTQADIDCLAATSFTQNAALYAPYLETLANSATPREYARFLRALGGTGLMSEAEREPLLSALDAGASEFSEESLALMNVDTVGAKHGTRYRVRTVAGLLWNDVPATPTTNDIDARYSFQVFAEGHTSSAANNGGFDTLYRAVVENAVRYLQAH